MGVYGSPELHPKLRNNPPPPKRKFPAIMKRVSFWLCAFWGLCFLIVDKTEENAIGMIFASCMSVMLSEGIALFYNAIKRRNARGNAIAVLVSVAIIVVLALYCAPSSATPG